MLVLGFVGSGRMGGNTDILVQQALSGAKENGAETRIFHLNNMNIKGCQGCEYCKSNEYCPSNEYCKSNEYCYMSDDMQEIYKAISSADAIIIGSPIYMMQLSAQTKLMIDRLYAFRNRDGSIKINQKKLMQIYVCGYDDPNVYKQYFDIMNSLFDFLKIFNIESTITVGGTRGKDYINSNSEVMQTVKTAGRKLTDIASQ